jgi:hypothetical protein
LQNTGWKNSITISKIDPEKFTLVWDSEVNCTVTEKNFQDTPYDLEEYFAFLDDVVPVPETNPAPHRHACDIVFTL